MGVHFSLSAPYGLLYVEGQIAKKYESSISCFQVSYSVWLELEPYSPPNDLQSKLTSCSCSLSSGPGETALYVGSHEMLKDRHSLNSLVNDGLLGSKSFAMNMLSENQSCPKLCLHLFLSAESHTHTTAMQRNTTVMETSHLPAASCTRVLSSKC